MPTGPQDNFTWAMEYRHRLPSTVFLLFSLTSLRVYVYKKMFRV